MGTPLREVIETIGGGRPARAVGSRRCSPACPTRFIPEATLDTPVSYEALAAIGSGLGSAGFIVLDDSDDLVARRGRRLALLGRRVVWPVHALQARWLAHRRAAWSSWPGRDATSVDLAALRTYLTSVADSARSRSRPSTRPRHQPPQPMPRRRHGTSGPPCTSSRPNSRGGTRRHTRRPRHDRRATTRQTTRLDLQPRPIRQNAAARLGDPGSCKASTARSDRHPPLLHPPRGRTTLRISI